MPLSVAGFALSSIDTVRSSAIIKGTAGLCPSFIVTEACHIFKSIFGLAMSYTYFKTAFLLILASFSQKKYRRRSEAGAY